MVAEPRAPGSRLRVLLCVMPFLPVERPALGASLLKALVKDFADCSVLYPSHEFCDAIGFDLYRRVAQLTPTHHLPGEWIFTRALYGDAALPDRDFEAFARAQAGNFYENAFLGQLRFARERATAFIESLAQRVDESGVDLVGFSTTFQQNLASLALARRLKALRPAVRIVFGGANCEGEMGEELMRQFPQIDFVCRGEADQSFPALVRHLARAEGAMALDDIPGLVYRQGLAEGKEAAEGGEGGVRVSHAPPMQLERMDDSPLPDHSDFVESFRRSTAPLFIEPELTAETSRGCWWGEKHHCTFCGLNGLGIRYRSKSPRRAIDEITALREAWGIDRFFFTDNIVDLRYFDEVFPALARNGAQLQLFYETKANLRHEQLRALRDVGTTWLQPGIEHLNSHVLRLMDKGIRGIQNVQTLKWAQQLGLLVTWNVLCGFPGEVEEDYEELIRFMGLIHHLAPPSSFSAFRLDRFSPMHNDPGRFGLTEIKPYPAYALCYQADERALGRLAYFFAYHGTSPPGVLDGINRAWQACEEWKRRHATSLLMGVGSEDFLLILDTRVNAQAPQYLLQGSKRWIYEGAAAICSPETLLGRLRALHPQKTWALAEVQEALDEFTATGLVLQEDNLYLSLALMQDDKAARAWDRELSGPSMPLRSVPIVPVRMA